MSKYILARLIFTLTSFMFFGAVVVLAAATFAGVFVGHLGMLFSIFCAFLALLLASMIYFILQKTHKDTPMRQKSELLTAYAADQLQTDEQPIRKFTVDEDLTNLMDTDALISLTLTDELARAHNGETIRLFSTLSTGALTAEVMSKQNGTIQLRALR